MLQNICVCFQVVGFFPSGRQHLLYMCYTADVSEDLFLMAVEHYTLYPTEQHCWEREQYKYASKKCFKC